MSIKPVTYYLVECDEPGCDVTTSDLSSDYSAWSDSGAALDDWTISDGISLDDGRTFCDEHGRGKVCDECMSEAPGIEKTDDGWLCPACANPVQMGVPQ